MITERRHTRHPTEPARGRSGAGSGRRGPDFTRIEKTLRREPVPGPIVQFELFSEIEDAVLERLEPGGRPAAVTAPTPALAAFQRHVRYMELLGYDYANLGRNWDFTRQDRPGGGQAGGRRHYLTSASQTIATTDDFERYVWPDVEQLDYSRFETVRPLLPDGMRIIAVCSGILENVTALLGPEQLGYLLFDNPELVHATFAGVARTIIAYYDRVASFETVGALCLSDDLGFKTQTLISPADLRTYLFPWHRRLVQTVHAYGKPIILHACGHLDEVMEDILACGWDAKHSFEDAIEPVWEARRKYGQRIALLGGFDLDKLCRMSPDEVRRHTRFLLESCHGPGWALGTGNSVADYVPVDNFLAMLEAGRRHAHDPNGEQS